MTRPNQFTLLYQILSKFHDMRVLCRLLDDNVVCYTVNAEKNGMDLRNLES